MPLTKHPASARLNRRVRSEGFVFFNAKAFTTLNGALIYASVNEQVPRYLKYFSLGKISKTLPAHCNLLYQ